MQSSAVASAVSSLPCSFRAPEDDAVSNVSDASDISDIARPYNGWYRRMSGEMVDGSTGDIYNDDDTATLRRKCAALAAANPLLNGYNLGATVWWRTRKACGHLRHGRLVKGMNNLGMAAASPALWVGMEGAALMGLAAPLHGRKWWGRMERHMVRGLAPCFQPLTHGGEAPLSAEELKACGYKQHLLRIQIGRARW